MSNPLFRAAGCMLAAGISVATLQAVETRADGLDAVRVSGEIGVEGRLFVHNPQFADQMDGLQPSLFGETNLEWEDDAGVHQVTVTPFFRIDGRDDERSHMDLREAYWRRVDDDYELLVGLNRVFWGVTESRHLVNVINQIDQVENTDEEDFLGQPMVNLTLQRDFGRFDLFVLPGFRERTFAGREGRLRLGLPVDDSAATYDSDLEEWNVDFALRYAHFIGDWDVGLNLFQGTGREPTLETASDGTRLIPHYDQITQAGLDLQYTTDAWLWKLEAIGRGGQGDAFAATVAGFEYTLFQVVESDADLGFLAEVLYDGRDGDAPGTRFDNDLFFGTRLTLNDVQDTNALLGAVVDWEDATTSLRLEADRRIGDHWRFELETQWLLQVDDGNGLAPFEEDSFIVTRLTRFF